MRYILESNFHYATNKLQSTEWVVTSRPELLLDIVQNFMQHVGITNDGMSNNKQNVGGIVDSAFHLSDVGEMSSNIINAAHVCRGCADRQRSPR